MLSSIPYYDVVRYRVVPPIFLVVFTCLVQLLVVLGNPGVVLSTSSLVGTPFAWKVVVVFYAYAFISLKVPAPKFLGPPTNTG